MQKELSVGDYVRRLNPAGVAGGKIVEVVSLDFHRPADGPESARRCVAYLYDGGWEFTWNLTRVGSRQEADASAEKGKR